MKLYRFLTGPDESSFCHKVTDALNKGWRLHGDPTYAYNVAENQMQCGQAVYKKVKKETYNPEIKLSDF